MRLTICRRSFWIGFITVLANGLLASTWAGTFPAPVDPMSRTADSPSTRPTSCPTTKPSLPTIETTRLGGFSGYWFGQGELANAYRYDLSGGMATAGPHNLPTALFAKQANRTFFIYAAGRSSEPNDHNLQIAIASFDHATQTLSPPRSVLEITDGDLTNLPALSMDGTGRLYIFAPATGQSGRSAILRTVEPYRLDQFERVADFAFLNPQPWYVDGQGFLLLYTHTNDQGRPVLFQRTSPDGLDWTTASKLADFGKGHHQVSGQKGKLIGTAFNVTTEVKGQPGPSNIYYLQTTDLGKTWKTVSGQPLKLPLGGLANRALIRDYVQYDRFVFLKGLLFDNLDLPVLLALVSRGTAPGPASRPRKWATGHWVGYQWEFNAILRTDSNHDMGTLFMEPMGIWRIIGPTRPAEPPQPYNAGNEIMSWTSDNHGRTWRAQLLTKDSPCNHNFVRQPIDARDDFYAFWCDGHGRKPSLVHLYFCNRDGEVFRMPAKISGEQIQPERVPAPFGD